MTHSLIRFIIFFVLTFSLLVFIYLQIPDDLLRLTIYPTFIVRPSLFLLEQTSALLQARNMNNIIYLGDKSLEIVRGCDGSGFIFIYSAAVIAYPARGQEKIVGVALGSLMLWGFNIIRVSGLIYLKKNFDAYFYLMHNMITPMLFCLICLRIFLMWINQVEKT